MKSHYTHYINGKPKGTICKLSALYFCSLFSASLSLLSPQSTMEWKQKKNLPVAMNSHHIVRIADNVYCGGGLTGKVSTDRLVFKYSRREDKWSQLPVCPSLHFGLTQLDEKLVTVGGRDTDALNPIDDVYMFEEDSQTWKNFNTPLSTARCFPCVVAYKSVLVVSGGIVGWKFDYEHPERTDTVEVFQDSQWHPSVPLPFALSAMSCAVVNDTCYIISGTKQGGSPNRQAYFIPIPSLIQTDHPEFSSKVSTSSPKWERHNCPLFFSTAVELDGHLLAIGGKDDSNKPSSAVHKYSPSTDSWEIIANGTLPTTKFHAAAISLEGGDIIVVGGKSAAKISGGNYEPSIIDKTVYIASEPTEQ